MQTEKSFREMLDKYLAGTCSPQEKAIISDWFEKGGNINKSDLSLNEQSRMQILSRIHEMQDSQASHNISTQKSKLRRFLTNRSAAAIWAAVFITAGIAAWKSGIISPLLSNKEFLAYKLIQTGKAEVKKVLLPDGSEVMLNANSRLEYHPDFTNHRHIRLYGEGLFSVTRDKAHPFTVNTNDSVTTTVLGTRFNIQSYDKSPETHITVVSGIVAVNKGSQSQDTLTRYQAARILKAEHSFTISHNVNTETVTGWIKGEWNFENLRFIDLSILLQNQYGITLTSRRNTELLQTGVNVNFNKKQSAKDILEVFCAFAGCSFRNTNTTAIEIY